MSRRTSGALPLIVTLDSKSSESLQQQIYEVVRSLILKGRLPAGTRLPSTRVLASELAVSRNTVLNAFERLAAEGYVVGKSGGGTRVSHTLPEDMLRARVAPGSRSKGAARRRTSRRAEAAAAVRVRPWSGSMVPSRPFRVGECALSEFPVKAWGRIARRRWSSSTVADLAYGEVAGYRPLRDAIARYLQVARGVVCDPEQVIIVNGSQHALDLATRILLDPGDSAWLEEPGYFGARGALVNAGARIVPVKVDHDGLDVTTGLRSQARARFAFVTPSHQFPLGVTMSVARRLQLLQWATKSGAWIFEDDYDSEFRYTSPPLPALQGLDTHGCVVYAGTFSKILFPSLRLGYMVVPPSLLYTLLKVRFLTEMYPHAFNQRVLTDFIVEGHFERHIRRMRMLYRERQEALLSAARRHLDGLLTVQPTEGGMHLVGWLPAGVDDRRAAKAAAEVGVEVLPLSFCSQLPAPRGGLILGYAGVTPRQIEDGAQLLARALEQVRKRR